MNSRSSGGWLEAFFTGKGFYIVLFLCAAVIGASAWMMAAGNGTMAEDVIEVSNTTTGAGRTEMILPPKRDDSQTLEEIIQESTQVFQEPEVQEEPGPGGLRRAARAGEPGVRLADQRRGGPLPRSGHAPL